jgi:hypothetical protein
MKKILFLIMLMGVTLSGYAQNEFSSKFKPIPPINKAPKIKKATPPENKDIPPIEKPNVFKNPNPLKSNSVLLEEKKPISMYKTNEFINPGDAVMDRLNKKPDDENAVFYRRNQNLGDFRTTSGTAKVSYRDAAFVDGDKIRVYLNDKVIEYQVDLDSQFKGFEITLVKGFNKIEFEALNQGLSGPNTAEFQVFDDKGKLISGSQWNLGTGFKATMILIKE